MKEFIRSAVAAAFLLTSIPSPSFAQFSDEDVGNPVMAMHDYQDILTSSTQGMVRILVERICEADASGKINVTVRAGDFDPQISSLWVEAHVLTPRGILAEVAFLQKLKALRKKLILTFPKMLHL